MTERKKIATMIWEEKVADLGVRRNSQEALDRKAKRGPVVEEDKPRRGRPPKTDE